MNKRTNSSHLPFAYVLFCIRVGKTGGHGLVIIFSVDVLKSTVKNLPCLFKRILQEKYRCTIKFLIQGLLSPAAWSLAKKKVWLLHCLVNVYHRLKYQIHGQVDGQIWANNESPWFSGGAIAPWTIHLVMRAEFVWNSTWQYTQLIIFFCRHHHYAQMFWYSSMWRRWGKLLFSLFVYLFWLFFSFSQRRFSTNERLAVSSCCTAKKACKDLDYNEVYMTLCPRLMVTLYGMKCTVQTQLEWWVQVKIISFWSNLFQS